MIIFCRHDIPQENCLACEVEAEENTNYKEGDKVRIKDNCPFLGYIGRVWTKGNGNYWQILLANGQGVYFSENQIEHYNGE